MPRLMQGTNILCGKFGVTDKGILKVRIPGINQNYRDKSRFLKAIYGAQVDIWKKKKKYCLSSRWDELKLDQYFCLPGGEGRPGRLREGR